MAPVIRKVFRFWAAGIPGFAIAAALNYVVVTFFKWPEALAYALALYVQISVNFVFCRKFVFEPQSNFFGDYVRFCAGIAAFRLFDWATYIALVKFLGVYFMVAQALNVFVFSLFKYKYSEAVFERPR